MASSDFDELFFESGQLGCFHADWVLVLGNGKWVSGNAKKGQEGQFEGISQFLLEIERNFRIFGHF